MVRFTLFLRRAAALLALPLLAGCVPALGPAPAPKGLAALPADRAIPSEQGTWPADGWWRAYGDPQLDQLIAEGLTGAPDVAAAAARLARAEGVAQAAGAPLGPSLTANANGGGIKQSYNNGIPKEFIPKGIRTTGTANLQLALDLDLWGRNRALRRAAMAERDAAALDAAEARLALSTAIASAYADLARLHAERAVTVDAVRIRTESAGLVGRRVADGLDTQGELRLAQAAVPATRADILALDESIEIVRHQIAALIGAGPDRGLAITPPKLAMLVPAKLPDGAGIGLLGRRPDIVAARVRVEAATQRERAAKAAFYPDLSLSVLAGVQSLGLSELAKQGSLYGVGGPALSLPLFDNGRRSGDYRAARADRAGAVASYDATLIAALREAADAVTSRSAVAAQESEVRASLAANDAAYRIARLRYEAGLSAYLSVLTAEEALVTARRRAADVAARAFAVDIALVRALGGGFSSPQER